MGRFRGSLILIALTLWRAPALAAPAPANLDRAGPPTLPLQSDDAATKAWVDRYIDSNGYLPAAAINGEGVFYSSKDVTRSKDGRPVVWVRFELGQSMNSYGFAVRSMRRQLELDCRAHRYFEHQIEGFSGANMLGAKQDGGGPSRHWFEVIAGSTDAAWFHIVCAALEPASIPSAPAPLPAPASPQALRAWSAANLNTNGFVIVGYTPLGVLMYGVPGLQLQPDGHVLASIRLEKPPQAGRKGAASQTLRIEIDCDGARSRTLNSYAYAENDLRGAWAPVQGSYPQPWEQLKSAGAGTDAARQICGQRSLLRADISRPAAMPTPPQVITDDTATAWLGEHIEPKGYAAVGYNDATTALYAPDKTTPAGRGHLRTWIRLEMFRPALDGAQVIRSMRSLAELDCGKHRIRYLNEERYPGSNLLGPATTASNPAKWDQPQPTTLTAAVMTKACSAGEAKPAAAGSAR